MNLLIVTLATPETGLGHYYRAITLASQAHQMGHKVTLMSNKLPAAVDYQTRLLRYPQVELLETDTDWLIIDTPSELPLPVEFDDHTRLCLIDGVGHSNGHQPDLVISQGLEGEYCAPDYLILRPEFFTSNYYNPFLLPSWFVWGGAADKLELRQQFTKAMADNLAYLIEGEFSQPVKNMSPLHTAIPTMDSDLIYWAGMCQKCAVAFGMSTWELLAMGKAVYAFSLTERHLKSAMAMDKRGWLKAWPKVGLPTPIEMETFLSKPFTPEPVVGLPGGTQRVVELLEARFL